MNARRRLLFGAAVVTPLLWALACSFPEPTFVPDEPGDGSDATADQTGETDAAVDGEASVVLPPDVDPEGGTHDATTVSPDASIPRPDAGPDADAGTPTCCDCDKDTHTQNATTCTGARDDCDDYNSGIHPGQDFVSSPWDKTSPHLPAGDWDCNGTTVKQYAYGVTCLLLTNCTEGFATNLDCGQTGTYNFCKQSLPIPGLPLTCQVDHSEQRTQGCR